jgi:hypothetical protein
MVDVIPFAEHWDEQLGKPEAARRAYLAEEIRRLVREGKPVVRAILGHPYQGAQVAALSIVRTNADEEGNQIWPEPPRFRLRLVEGVTPPPCDAQGRNLPDELRGKTLRVKVGNVGAALHDLHLQDASRAKAGSAETRKAKEATGRDLYQHLDITREPREVSLEHAVSILRAWGKGLVDKVERALVEEIGSAEPARARKG